MRYLLLPTIQPEGSQVIEEEPDENVEKDTEQQAQLLEEALALLPEQELQQENIPPQHEQPELDIQLPPSNGVDFSLIENSDPSNSSVGFAPYGRVQNAEENEPPDQEKMEDFQTVLKRSGDTSLEENALKRRKTTSDTEEMQENDTLLVSEELSSIEEHEEYMAKQEKLQQVAEERQEQNPQHEKFTYVTKHKSFREYIAKNPFPTAEQEAALARRYGYRRDNIHKAAVSLSERLRYYK